MSYSAWKWSRQLPSPLTCRISRRNRESKIVDAFFHSSRSLDIKKVLTFLGQPDGFSTQQLYSPTQGSKKPMVSGGTMRFLLNDGGEVHLSTYDFTRIDMALRWNRLGRGELLFK